MPIYDKTHSFTPSDLILRNREWAAAMLRRDSSFFERLVAQQTPEYLWIGCSDSRVPANEIVGMAPGELFVHRNVANLVIEDDLNCMSVIQYAVDVLKVQHIMVTGHSMCGGIRAVLERNTQQSPGDLISQWLRPVVRVAEAHAAELEGIASFGEQWNRLCELNVEAQVESLAQSSVIRNAWNRGQSLSVHGWVYGIHDGLLRQLTEARNGETAAT